jgi:tetratricopeptide (TPR) repeat protein
MRFVFSSGAQNLRLDSSAPLLVLAPRDLATMGRISSWEHVAQSSAAANYFRAGWEKQFAVMRLDAPNSERLFTDYVDSLLNLNFRPLPLWLDRGLARLYGASQFKDSTVLVGAQPSDAFFSIGRTTLIPLKTLFSIDRFSLEQPGPTREFFPVESWALAHYLTFGPDMEDGKRMVQFYSLLQSGSDQEKAFTQVFGPIQDVEIKLEKYVRQYKFKVWEIKSPSQIQPQTFAVRTLSLAEADAELAGANIWVGRDLASARSLLTKALTEDPSLALAHENMGFVYFADGKDDDALREFSKAFELDPSRYLSLFYKTMLSPIAHSHVPADQALFDKALFQTLQLNPQFAPAYVQAAFLYARQGHTQRALAAAIKAAQLEPSRAGYLLLEANLLLQLDRRKEAATILQFVANHWRGPDRDEALELWDKIPSQQRPEQAPQYPKEPLDLKSDVKHVDGIISSSGCDRKGADPNLTLTLESGGQTLAFRESGLPMGWNSSDTIWFAEDHVDLCHHIEGLHAFVRYKPTSARGVVGDLLQVDIRDQPLPTPIPVQQDKAPEKKE